MTDHDDEQIFEPEDPEWKAVEVFLDALRAGDEYAAAKALRKLVELDGELKGSALKTLADCFEGHADWLHPWGLRFRRPGRGAPPTDPLLAGARTGEIIRAVEKALTKPNMNLKAAVAEVGEGWGLSEKTVYEKYRASKKSTLKKKTST
jgi:hypothetical protein